MHATINRVKELAEEWSRKGNEETWFSVAQDELEAALGG